jgi:predicted glycosyltransferase involved in capsule biosynthesis
VEDLSNVTIMIPVRIDSTDRIDNINLTIDYISNNYNTNIMVFESSSERKFFRDKDIKYTYIKDDNENFHRTSILNMMIEEATTDVVMNYDADILLYSKAYSAGYRAIDKGMCGVLYPYNGTFLALSRNYHYMVKECGYAVERMPLDKVTSTVHTSSVGGAFMALKDTYKKYGGENEKFMAWGYEDNERMYRFTTLHGEIPRANTPLVHLEHWRGPNSSFENPHIENSKKELALVNSMGKQELLSYISGWKNSTR